MNGIRQQCLYEEILKQITVYVPVGRKVDLSLVPNLSNTFERRSTLPTSQS